MIGLWAVVNAFSESHELWISASANEDAANGTVGLEQLSSPRPGTHDVKQRGWFGKWHVITK